MRVILTGDLDLRAVPMLHRVLADVISTQPRDVVLDLAAVTLLDCTVFAVFVGAAQRLAAVGGQIRVVNANGVVQRTLAVLGVADLIRDDPSPPQSTN